MTEEKAALATLAVRLTEEEHRAIKVLCASRQMTLREWYGEAFDSFVNKREKLEENGSKFFYRARPADAKQVSMATDRSVVKQVKSWAEKDNVRFVAAYYTALVEYLEESKPEGGVKL